MSNLFVDAWEWLEQQFEYEFCAECGGDEFDHHAIPFMGNWFAMCIDGEVDEAQMERNMLRASRRLHV